MHYSILIFLILAGIILFLMRSNPALLAKTIRIAGGFALIGIGITLTVRGAILIGGPLVLLGLGLMTRGFAAKIFNPFGGINSKRSKGGQSEIKTAVLAMELDHDTGTMDGQVLSGDLQGKRLSSLTKAELLQVMELCQSASDQSLAVFEAYMDREHPDWRVGGKKHSGQTGKNAHEMTVDEAYSVLGLKPGASAKEIIAAHRRLIKKFHPDQGGSDDLATRINKAKDRLLNV